MSSATAVETIRQSFLRLPPAHLDRIREQDPRFYEALMNQGIFTFASMRTLFGLCDFSLISCVPLLDAFFQYSQAVRPLQPELDLTTADPLDPDVQRKIEGLIRYTFSFLLC